MIPSDSSLARFQSLNKEIYLATNDCNHSNMEMFSRLHRHITQVLKAVRKKKHETMGYHLCMALSWSFALANRFHINLANEMWEFFPGFCLYCSDAPCSCKERARERRKLKGESNGEQPVSLFDWQAMFAKIYPNVVINSAMHLAEEAGEVDEAIRNYSATHDPNWFRKIVEELVDVITNIFGVANCLHINLAVGMAGYFGDGCSKCHKSPCDCGYVATDQPILLYQKIS